jgi:HSP20 family protein
LTQKIRGWHNCCVKIFQQLAGIKKQIVKNSCVFNGFPVFAQLAFPKLKEFLLEQKYLTKRKIMKLTKYERPGLVWPSFGRLANLQDELDQLFESPQTGWAPALDVHEDANNFIIRAELPGLKREDIEVSLQDGALVISGERKSEKVEEGVEIHRQERFYGKFQRALTLPTPVAADKVKAQYKDGVLTITLPKTEEAKPKQIDVSAN